MLAGKNKAMLRIAWLNWLVLFILLLGLGGCGNTDVLDSGDMKDVELVTALAVDKPEGGAQILATVQLLNRDKALDRQYAASYYTLAAMEINLPAAIGELYHYGARQMNFSHTTVLLLGEAAADCDYWLDYALRSSEIRPTVYPIICRQQAGELMAGAAEDISLTYLLNNILEPLGSSRPGAAAITLQNFVEEMMQPGITPALPLVEQNEAGVEFAGFVLYDDAGHVAAVLTADDDAQVCAGWLWLQRPKYLRGYTLELDNDVVLQVESASVQKRLQTGADVGKPDLQFRLSLRAQVLNNPQALPDAYLQTLTRQRLHDLAVAALAASRKYNLDFIGLGREVYRQQPELWEEMAEQDYLNLLTVSLEIEADIES